MLGQLAKLATTSVYGPVGFRPMATYRAIAAILNAFRIRNNQGGPVTAQGVKQVMRRPVDPILAFSIETIGSRRAWKTAVDQT